MTDRPRPEDFMAMGLFVYEFSRLERVVTDALIEGLAVVQKPIQTDRVQPSFLKRVQLLQNLHRRRAPLDSCQLKVEPLLKEVQRLLPIRNHIAHGRPDEYGHDVLSGAERVAALRRELIAAMTWRTPA
jgi:hypothetical protein